MSYLDRISECNAYALDRFVPFEVGGRRLGWVRRDRLAILRSLDAFDIDAESVSIPSDVVAPSARSALLDGIVEELTDQGEISGYRGELYPLKQSFSDSPALVLERAAVPYFGGRAWGVHVNGFVRKGGRIHMWVARRSRVKPTYPGKLDNMIAGGQPDGIALLDNVVKEAAEEASVPEALARSARPVGIVTYCMENDSGLKPDCMFCFDLELPTEFVPRAGDDEVESFHLMAIEEVGEIVRGSREFKMNCNLVVIDFLVRHGVLAADEPDYERIVRGLHGGELR